jgi:hypothetical protein
MVARQGRQGKKIRSVPWYRPKFFIMGARLTCRSGIRNWSAHPSRCVRGRGPQGSLSSPNRFRSRRSVLSPAHDAMLQKIMRVKVRGQGRTKRLKTNCPTCQKHARDERTLKASPKDDKGNLTSARMPDSTERRFRTEREAKAQAFADADHARKACDPSARTTGPAL